MWNTANTSTNRSRLLHHGNATTVGTTNFKSIRSIHQLIATYCRSRQSKIKVTGLVNQFRSLDIINEWHFYTAQLESLMYVTFRKCLLEGFFLFWHIKITLLYHFVLEVNKTLNHFPVFSSIVFCLQLCTSNEGRCNVVVDGFYIETAICLVVGFLWLQWGRPTINRLQRLPASAWQISLYNR